MTIETISMIALVVLLVSFVLWVGSRQAKRSTEPTGLPGCKSISPNVLYPVTAWATTAEYRVLAGVRHAKINKNFMVVFPKDFGPYLAFGTMSGLVTVPLLSVILEQAEGATCATWDGKHKTTIHARSGEIGAIRGFQILETEGDLQKSPLRS
ncbi:MAG TPA: hypothetical protein VEA59_02690 [Patescibacteria group bacterium]|nr:hypothetical protein [Patescibacteria group bacterium]